VELRGKRGEKAHPQETPNLSKVRLGGRSGGASKKNRPTLGGHWDEAQGKSTAPVKTNSISLGAEKFVQDEITFTGVSERFQCSGRA